MEWGNLAMRTGEESTDCPNVSKITHRYVPDSQESLQHCRACQEVGGTAVTSNLAHNEHLQFVRTEMTP